MVNSTSTGNLLKTKYLNDSVKKDFSPVRYGLEGAKGLYTRGNKVFDPFEGQNLTTMLFGAKYDTNTNKWLDLSGLDVGEYLWNTPDHVLPENGDCVCMNKGTEIFQSCPCQNDETRLYICRGNGPRNIPYWFTEEDFLCSPESI